MMALPPAGHRYDAPACLAWEETQEERHAFVASLGMQLQMAELFDDTREGREPAKTMLAEAE